MTKKGCVKLKKVIDKAKDMRYTNKARQGAGGAAEGEETNLKAAGTLKTS